MNDVGHLPQSLLVIGANSDIAVACVDALANGPLRCVTLASRRPVETQQRYQFLRQQHPNLEVHHTELPKSAHDTARQQQLVDNAATAMRDIDTVLIAIGELGTVDSGIGRLDRFDEARRVAESTFTLPSILALYAADALVRQGHGSLVVLSSAAALRPRRTNPMYGAAKAGLDGLVVALGERLHDTGVHVMVVRPGFVISKMTAQLGPTPRFAITPERVAADIVEGIRKQRRVVWTPKWVAPVAVALQLVPSSLARRISR